MKFVMASGNLHKAEEIRATLPSDIELILQSELGVDSAEETGGTFVENALIKAKHAASVTGMPAIADDSGLCVEALGGAPGIFSA
ncbi:MAG: non-canonical purine NTP pyrophosphatase, partial [Pseudomonadales bacterium]|nr:non-canonical purine NTP pyrophosphatase [Pseudomonadales bacterium]